MIGRHGIALAVGMLVLSAEPARSQDPGQPYQIPAGYEGVSAGSSISYGGVTYVVQTDGTMLLEETQSGDTDQASEPEPTAYKIPEGYGSHGPGTTIFYNGVDYVIQDDGTMVSAGDDPWIDPIAYQIPAGYDGYANGTTFVIGGSAYVVQNHVMYRVRPGFAGAGRFPVRPAGPTGGLPRARSLAYSSGFKGAAAGPVGPRPLTTTPAATGARVGTAVAPPYRRPTTRAWPTTGGAIPRTLPTRWPSNLGGAGSMIGRVGPHLGGSIGSLRSSIGGMHRIGGFR